MGAIIKTLEIETATESLSTYARELGAGETVMLTANDEPIALIVSLRNVDQESLALSTSAEFMELIVSAREEIKLGMKLSLDEMKTEIASTGEK